MDASLRNIFITGFNNYRQRHGLSMDQYKAAQAIMTCQRQELGYEEWSCDQDDHVERINHSCRHRSCPRCNHDLTQHWLEKTQSRLLPCDHYHVVFTLPHELNRLWHYNRHWCSDHLFKASSETLQQLLNDERYLGAKVGMLSSLHTWGRTLSFHPHVHVLVTGGGLAGREWREVKKDFLLPVGVIKARFRGKWLAWLNEAYDNGALKLPPDWTELTWRKTLSQIAKKHWNVSIRGAYEHGRGVAVYLSRYVRGGPIKDSRLLKADQSHVIFRYWSYRDDKEAMLNITTENFITRVLWHIPVKGQHNLRYYGIYVPGAVKERDQIRLTMGKTPGESYSEPRVRRRNCPKCGQPLLHRLSMRRKISYLESAIAQQGVRADRETTSWLKVRDSYKPPPGFFGLSGGCST